MNFKLWLENTLLEVSQDMTNMFAQCFQGFGDETEIQKYFSIIKDEDPELYNAFLDYDENKPVKIERLKEIIDTTLVNLCEEPHLKKTTRFKFEGDSAFSSLISLARNGFIMITAKINSGQQKQFIFAGNNFFEVTFMNPMGTKAIVSSQDRYLTELNFNNIYLSKVEKQTPRILLGLWMHAAVYKLGLIWNVQI